jgi:fucose permease
MSRSVRHDEQGKSVGLRTTGNRLVGAVIPIVMGALADWIGLTASFLVIGAVLVFGMGLVALYVHRTPAFRE